MPEGFGSPAAGFGSPPGAATVTAVPDVGVTTIPEAVVVLAGVAVPLGAAVAGAVVVLGVAEVVVGVSTIIRVPLVGVIDWLRVESGTIRIDAGIADRVCGWGWGCGVWVVAAGAADVEVNLKSAAVKSAPRR